MRSLIQFLYEGFVFEAEDLFYFRSSKKIRVKIAVNTRLLLHNKLEGIGWFSYENLRRIAAAHPEHEFIFLFDRPAHSSFLTSSNIKAVVVPPPTRHPILWRIWFDFTIPRVIRKHGADVFLSPDGFLSQRLKIPQVAVIHDLNFEHYPKDLKPSHSNYYRKYFPRFAKIARRIATVSEFSKSDIVKQYHISPDKIDVVYNGVNTDFKPAAQTAVDQFKETHTGSADYFIFVGAMHPRKNISRLMQAFDRVKNNTDRDIKLLLVGQKYWWNEEIKQVYENMQFREDVVFTGHVSVGELQTALSGALALTFVPYFEGFGIPILEGFATDCPVITSNITSMPEIAGDAAELVDPFSVESIANGMQRVLSDGDLRTEMIAKGRSRLANFSWDKTAELLWKTVEKALEKA